MERKHSRDIFSHISQSLPVHDVNQLQADQLIPSGMRLSARHANKRSISLYLRIRESENQAFDRNRNQW